MIFFLKYGYYFCLYLLIFKWLIEVIEKFEVIVKEEFVEELRVKVEFEKVYIVYILIELENLYNWEICRNGISKLNVVRNNVIEVSLFKVELI